jgi:hypothetical protein
VNNSIDFVSLINRPVRGFLAKVNSSELKSYNLSLEVVCMLFSK